MVIKGNVKWFDIKKGFGFIVGPQGQDVFVHYSQIQTDGFKLLKDGEEVEYDLVESAKGFQAQAIKRLNPPPDERPVRSARMNPAGAQGFAKAHSDDDDARYNR